MANETLDKKLSYFDRLERANDRALKSMAALRSAVEKSDREEIIQGYMGVVKNAYWMAANYRLLGRKDLYINFCSRFNDIEMATGSEIEKHLTSLGFGEEKQLDLYKLVEELKYEESSHGYDRFETCHTLHDLVRCLHASSLNYVFSGMGMENDGNHLNFDSGTFNIVSDNEHDNEDLLKAMTAIYEEGVEKRGSENYNVLSTENRLSTRIIMGCHSSCLDIKARKFSYDISFKFANTSAKVYQNADYRRDYVVKMLEKFQFSDIEPVDTIIFAKKKKIKKKEMPKLLKEVIRMLASTKDLDLGGSGINRRVDEAVSAFIDGKTDMYGYLATTPKKG